jgi:hypothetical protein
VWRSNTLDISHNSCGTGILPVVDYLFRRSLLDISHNCGTGILPVQDWLFGRCLLWIDKTRPYRVCLANQVIGDVCLRGDDGIAIEFIQQGIHDPIQQVDRALIAVGAVAVQVMAIEDRIANPY